MVLFTSSMALLFLHPEVRTVAYPALSAQDLLTNPSLAKEYNVKGMLIVSAQSENANLTATPGQLVTATFSLRFISYDPTLQSILVSFAPRAGEEVAGSIDVSSLESVSPAAVTVGAQGVMIHLTFRAPNVDSGSYFSLVPDGLTTSPYMGIVVYYGSGVGVVVP